MPAVLDVDPEVYTSAGLVFLRANGDACDIVNDAASAVGEGGGMAGSDSGGVDWARTYDGVAGAALAAGATLADGLGHLADLLDRTASNHERADSSSVPPPPGAAGPPSYCGSGTGVPGAQSILVPGVPSADGTPGDPPTGWSLVAHLIQYTWPNGHQDRLRAVASGWRTAAQGLHPVADSLTAAITEVSAMQSPEVGQAVATCTTVQDATRSLADAYATLGQACDDYAGYLDDAHAQVVEELALFAVESAGTQLLAAVLAAPTLGASEVAGQGVQLAKTAATAAQISRILQRLIEVVAEVTERIEPIVTHVADVNRTLQAVLDKASGQAAAVAAAAAAVPALPVDLRAIEGKGKKQGHTIANHVGLSDDDLKQRAQDEGKEVTSTFTDLNTAEWATAANLAAHQREIHAWLSANPPLPPLPMTLDLGKLTGRVYSADTKTYALATRVTTVVKRVSATSYIVRTSYAEE